MNRGGRKVDPGGWGLVPKPDRFAAIATIHLSQGLLSSSGRDRDDVMANSVEIGAGCLLRRGSSLHRGQRNGPIRVAQHRLTLSQSRARAGSGRRQRHTH